MEIDEFIFFGDKPRIRLYNFILTKLKYSIKIEKIFIKVSIRHKNILKYL